MASSLSISNIVALHHDVELDLARHNCSYRTVNGGTVIKDVILYTYRKKLEEPDRTEGFSKVLKIPFVPKFDSIFDEKLYEMYLP